MTCDRRAVLAGAGAGIAGALLGAWPAGATVAALPVPPGGRLAFDVVRNGSKLGQHVLTFHGDSDRLTVAVAVDIAFSIGPITLFRYAHRATERWADGEVAALATTTRANGSRYAVSATRDGRGLSVQAADGSRYLAPPDAMPATHWNRREMDGPWINTQDGKLLRLSVTPLGMDTIPAAGGRRIGARHWRIGGDARLDMWYDEIGWAGLAFVKGGAPVVYERQG